MTPCTLSPKKGHLPSITLTLALTQGHLPSITLTLSLTQGHLPSITLTLSLTQGHLPGGFPMASEEMMTPDQLELYIHNLKHKSKTKSRVLSVLRGGLG